MWEIQLVAYSVLPNEAIIWTETVLTQNCLKTPASALAVIQICDLPLCSPVRYQHSWANKTALNVDASYMKTAYFVVQKAFLLGLGLFWGELIFGGACYQKEFCTSEWVGLDKKELKTLSSLKQLKTVIVHGLIFGRAYYRKDICVWDLGELIFGRAYYFFLWGGGGGLIIGILR